MALLECKNLCVGYGSNVVQENLNFAIDKGDYFLSSEKTAAENQLC